MDAICYEYLLLSLTTIGFEMDYYLDRYCLIIWNPVLCGTLEVSHTSLIGGCEDLFPNLFAPEVVRFLPGWYTGHVKVQREHEMRQSSSDL